MTNTRRLATDILLKIEREKAYSNITLNSFFTDTDLSSQDKAFISALVYGVLDRKLTLDYVLSRFMKTPLKKTAPFTLTVLRTALYQIMFMDKIPPSAAVNEAVKLVKKSRESRNSGFVNAVLRAILREETLLPTGDNVAELSVRFSVPCWIVESFIRDYGIDNAKALLEESLKTPPLTIRVNTQKTTVESLKAEFESSKIGVEDANTENSLVLKNGFNIAKNESFKKGEFYVQDMASQKAVTALSPKKGDRVLDMCAAPGGKSFSMALLMENEGEIISCDLYEQRVGLIKSTAEKLGLSIIKPKVADALRFDETLGKFDCIFCDVPCSGLGVMRRKPDIKYKDITDFAELEDIQYNILCNAVKYLKNDGKILYSTCTLRRGENENVVNKFLENHSGFSKVNEKTLMPHIDKTDGFFYCLLKKER